MDVVEDDTIIFVPSLVPDNFNSRGWDNVRIWEISLEGWRK